MDAGYQGKYLRAQVRAGFSVLVGSSWIGTLLALVCPQCAPAGYDSARFSTARLPSEVGMSNNPIDQRDSCNAPKGEVSAMSDSGGQPAETGKSTGMSLGMMYLIMFVILGFGGVITAMVVIHNQDVAEQQAKEKAQEQEQMSAKLHAWAALCQTNPSRC